jgi:hypothetical protein
MEHDKETSSGLNRIGEEPRIIRKVHRQKVVRLTDAGLCLERSSQLNKEIAAFSRKASEQDSCTTPMPHLSKLHFIEQSVS